VSIIARACIARVRDRQEIVIHANPADIETLNRYRDQFIRLEDLGALRIIEDSRVGLPGGILIETSSGEIDARVETQLDRIRQEFTNVMEADMVRNPWEDQQAQ
jgi:flagellar biosynthesis/type III secretory pathway protein FliH